MDKMTLSYLRYIYKLIGIFFKICIPIVKTKLLDLYKLQRGECHFMKGFFFGGRVSFRKTLKEIIVIYPIILWCLAWMLIIIIFCLKTVICMLLFFLFFLITWVSKTSFWLITWVCRILMFHTHHVITRLNGCGGDPKGICSHVGSKSQLTHHGMHITARLIIRLPLN